VLDARNVTMDETQLYESKLFQESLQFGLFIMMFLSVPTMLFAKPLFLRLINQRQARRNIGSMVQRSDLDIFDEPLIEEKVDTEVQPGEHGDGHGEEFEFGQVMIHQMIHTIEYVLVTVSNTASNPRLWALSLAHAELSEVFYPKTQLEMMTSSGVMLFICVSTFYAMTFCVLIIMHQLECFLHALRLHWVEFQNKFYNADGIEFEPVSYTRLSDEKNKF